ncbi:CLM9 protein, partial [Thryothorus ludovicianus]|nr:CLM9 protein [Thryothorus ludovicianus]
LQGQPPEAQRRREGDTLYIQCPYQAWTTDKQVKYWRFQKDGTWQNLAYAYLESSQQSRDGRVEIKDNSTSKTVSITMTHLKTQDSGTYSCAVYHHTYLQLKTISLNVFKGWVPTALSVPQAHTPGVFQGPSSTELRSQAMSPSNGNTFLILTVVLLILLLLALVASVALGVRHYRLLGRAGNREAEDSSDRANGTAQPGSTGRRESSQDGSKGPAYINLEMQSHSPEDPLYCNVEPSQAPRNPQHVDYAIIAFNQAPRSGRE